MRSVVLYPLLCSEALRKPNVWERKTASTLTHGSHHVLLPHFWNFSGFRTQDAHNASIYFPQKSYQHLHWGICQCSRGKDSNYFFNNKTFSCFSKKKGNGCEPHTKKRLSTTSGNKQKLSTKIRKRHNLIETSLFTTWKWRIHDLRAACSRPTSRHFAPRKWPSYDYKLDTYEYNCNTYDSKLGTYYSKQGIFTKMAKT